MSLAVVSMNANHIHNANYSTNAAPSAAGQDERS